MRARVVALLRGVNVGRGNRIAMAELRGLLTDLGYTDVATLLNSGNAVFTVSQSIETVATDIEEALSRMLSVKSAVVVRTAEELGKTVAQAPLLDIMTDPAKFLVGFLSGDPKAAGVTAVGALDVGPDQVRLIGRELYLWCPTGILASPLSKVPWDKTFGVTVTMRNWNTVTKLLALVG